VIYLIMISYLEVNVNGQDPQSNGIPITYDT